MTCKNCLHYDACLDNQVCGEFEFVTNVDYEDMKEWCGSFQNKADFMEVVRCEKCKHWHKSSIKGILGDAIGYCHNVDFPFNCEHRPCMRSNDFCSYGERRDE